MSPLAALAYALHCTDNIILYYTGFPHHWESASSKHGLCTVSADYRLAPQVRFPAIMQACANVMSFLRSEEFGKATEGRVDQSKICVSGGSAGEYTCHTAFFRGLRRLKYDTNLNRRLARSSRWSWSWIRGMWYNPTCCTYFDCCDLPNFRFERSVRCIAMTD